MNIQQLVGCRSQSGDVGIEIEVEGENLPYPELLPDYWKMERDNSLRGESAEYILRRPVPIKDVEKNLKKLQKIFQDHGSVVADTHRAGVHVHINVQDLTPKELITYICAYFILEEVFLGFCDKSRVGNHFCLRMSDASYTLDVITEAIQQENLELFANDELRYASLNLTSIYKYGSLEFRSLESTRDYDKIALWSKTLHHLKEFSKQVGNPVDLLGRASEAGFSNFVVEALGPYAKFFNHHDNEEKVEQGVRNIQYAIYARDWDQVNLNIFQKRKLF